MRRDNVMAPSCLLMVLAVTAAAQPSTPPGPSRDADVPRVAPRRPAPDVLRAQIDGLAQEIRVLNSDIALLITQLTLLDQQLAAAQAELEPALAAAQAALGAARTSDAEAVQARRVAEARRSELRRTEVQTHAAIRRLAEQLAAGEPLRGATAAYADERKAYQAVREKLLGNLRHQPLFRAAAEAEQAARAQMRRLDENSTSDRAQRIALAQELLERQHAVTELERLALEPDPQFIQARHRLRNALLRVWVARAETAVLLYQHPQRLALLDSLQQAEAVQAQADEALHQWLQQNAADRAVLVARHEAAVQLQAAVESIDGERQRAQRHLHRKQREKTAREYELALKLRELRGLESGHRVR